VRGMSVFWSRRQGLGVCLGSFLAAAVARAAPSARKIFLDAKVAALVEAALSRDAGRAAELVRAGANPNARGDRNVTLLQWAILNKSHTGFDILLDLGADPTLAGLDGDGAIHFAAKADDPAYLRMILDRRAAVDARNSMTGRTPLMEALTGNRDRQMDMLRAAGASLAAADRMGNTPLHIAAQIGNSEQVLAMLEQGAPARARNRQGKTFQTYFFMTPERVLNARARAARQAVRDWLMRNGIGAEP